MEMDLEIVVRNNFSIPVIELAGEVDAYTSSRFRETMVDLLDGGATNLVISMDKVEYIDSSGLGALVGGLKRASEKQGKIALVCCNPQVTKVFEITGLERVFPLYESEKQAVDGLEAGQ